MYYIKRSSYLENARKSGLSHHVIGYDQLLRTKMYVSAVITQKDLGKGKSPTNESRQWVKEVGVEGDQAGHIIAEQFGGSGDKENIFPQNPEFNMGCWRVIEETIKNHLTTNACGDCKIPSVRVEFGYYYANFFRYPRRPSSFIYHFRFMCHDPGSKEPIQINELKDDIMNPVEQEKNLKRPNKRPLEHDELLKHPQPHQPPPQGDPYQALFSPEPNFVQFHRPQFGPYVVQPHRAILQQHPQLFQAEIPIHQQQYFQPPPIRQFYRI
uniref:Type VII secretion system protein EssD-like domain-containing protein n=1 Tax=Panagrolaimus sp. ES5 TaxID=591445 RepID=A0AC34FZU9_9BILA